MSTTADPTLSVVLVWREAGSRRLRTYVDDSTYRPLSVPLSTVEPAPDRVITEPDDLDAYLASPPPPPSTAPLREPVIALTAELAASHLGWTPTSPTTAP